MPTFRVIITRDITESTVVTVEARDEADAADVAMEKLDNRHDTVWQVDDGSWNNSETYATDVSEVPEYEVTFTDSIDKYAVIHTPSGIITDGRFDDRENAQMWADHLNEIDSTGFRVNAHTIPGRMGCNDWSEPDDLAVRHEREQARITEEWKENNA